VTQVNLTRAFASMFLNEPHSVTRSYKSVRGKIGSDIFGKNHKLHPYYTAAFALYRLEYMFRNHRIDAIFKAARYHLLYAVRLLTAQGNVPPKNSHAMEVYCHNIDAALADRSEEVFAAAVEAVQAAGVTLAFNRDVIRTLPFTEQVENECKRIRQAQS
jgi:hypothetical protein